MSVPKNPRDVHVDVILNSVTPGDFTIAPSPLGSLPTGPNGELIFQNAGFPGFFVHFDLQDRTGLGYRFPPPSKINEAVWSELGSGTCPQLPGKWDVFNPRSVTPNGMTLVVHNPNPCIPPNNVGQGPFGYTLRVTKDGGSTYLPLDPGGDNQNGPISRFDWSYVLVGVGSAIATTATIALAVSLSGHQLFCPAGL